MRRLRQVFSQKCHLQSASIVQPGDPWRAERRLPNLCHLLPLQAQPQEPGLSRIWKINVFRIMENVWDLVEKVFKHN